MVSREAASGCPAENSLLCSRRHWSIYWLLIVLALTPVGWRTANVINPDTAGSSPMFSANDRSRWCSVAALVEEGVWEIDKVIENERSNPDAVRWDTIDKVQHRGRDGRVHSYSSKPPLLSAIVASEYWLLRRITGWQLTETPLPVVRTLLTVNHLVCLAVLMMLLASFLEPMFVSDWTRYFVVAVAGWGTFLTTFAVTLNNHLPAATTAMATVWLADRMMRYPDRSLWSRGFWAGIFAALTVAFELPAASLAGIVALIVLYRTRGGFFAGFVPAAALVAAVVVGLNWWAHGTWRPAYSFRGDGPQVARIQGAFADELDRGNLPAEIRGIVVQQLETSGNRPVGAARYSAEASAWMGAAAGTRWIVTDETGNGVFAIHREGDDQWTLHEWGNWYDFPGSYWRTRNDQRSEVDRGTADQWQYAFHFLVGHHGVLLLTPVWLLAFAGMLPLATSRTLNRRWLGLATLVVTVVVTGFYLTRPEHDRNYGGVTSGPRWLFWLIPLWLISMVPVVQMLARWQWGKTVCMILLAASMLSAMYSWTNPWVHPWPWFWYR